MFYWIYEQFGAGGYVPGINLLQYLTVRIGAALFTAQLIVMLMGSRFIRWMQAKQGKGQPIRTDGIQRHVLEKAGTPTMGGFMILAGLLIAALLWADLSNIYVWGVILVTGGYGVLGFLDDYKKVTKQTTAGVSGRTKLIIQIAIAVLACYLMVQFGPVDPNNPRPDVHTSLTFPVFKRLILDLGWFYLAFGAFVIVGASNAVNLTDGLDGLAIVPTIICAGVFALIAYLVGNRIFADYLQLHPVAGVGELTVFCSALIGAGMGFLWFNAPPAAVFMGDIGSLALGGALGAVAMATKHELVLMIVGGLFVVETVSVIIQVFWFKRTGPRVFLMAPLHHHFEKKGWAEPTIVIRFWIVSMILALVGLATLKIR